MSTLEVNKITPVGVGTSVTLGDSGDTFTIPSGVTLDGSSATLTGFGTATVNGITEADQWRMTADKTGTGIINTNLERVDTDGGGYIGTGMTQSSGNFSFPSTGIWLISLNTLSDGLVYITIETTQDNSSYNAAASCYSDSSVQSGNCQFIFDVTDTSTHKVNFNRFGGSGTLYGSTSINQTSFTFIRLGDT